MADLIIPIVHLNGTSKRELLAQISNANHALIAAVDALQKMSPNGRDYYLTGNLKEAEKAHRDRVLKVMSVQTDIMAIGEAIADQEE